MKKLSKQDEKVRQFIIDKCLDSFNPTISYQQLSDACGLGLSLSNGPNADHKKMCDILLRISIYELSNGRELLSAPVVRAVNNVQGKGFFRLCEQLGIREKEEALYPMLIDDRRFGVAMIHKCRKFWQNEDNYRAYYSLPDSADVA